MLIAISIIAGFLLIAATVLAVSLVSQRRANARLSAQVSDSEALYQSQRQELEKQNQMLVVERTEAQARLGALQERLQSEQKNQETLEQKFDLLARKILDEKTKQFKDTNRESLESLLRPFGHSLSEFKERVEKIHSSQNEQQGALKNEIRNLLELNRKITEETTNLTNALRGNNKVQGDWGEMILETILESSNLIGGIHYTTQENLKDERGNNLRPDVILNLPGEKRIVIDSKVSLTGFVNYCGEEDAAGRDRALKEHVRSVRAHVDELGAKRYQALVASPDFVIMFIPNEPAFLAALQADPQIWNDAYKRKVIISSPTNLFAVLKMVDDLWKRDSQNRNAMEIADEAGKMYDKFVGFVETLEAVGKGIKHASDGYDHAIKQLSTGSGNLVGRTEKLRKLGVKASKTLSPKYTAAALDEPEEHAPDTEQAPAE